MATIARNIPIAILGVIGSLNKIVPPATVMATTPVAIKGLKVGGRTNMAV